MERYSTEIQCTDFTFLTNKNEQQQGNQPQQQTQQASQPQQQSQNSVVPDEDDDLPF